MKDKIHMILIVLGINFLFTTILGLLNEYNVVSYAFGIYAMGVSNVVLDMRLNK